MNTDARIKTDTVDDLLSIQPLHLVISIKLIEVRHAQCQIGIGKQINSLCFGGAHKQSVHIFFDSIFLQKYYKNFGKLHYKLIIYIGTYDDTAWVQAVIQSLAFTQEFHAESNVLAASFFSRMKAV